MDPNTFSQKYFEEIEAYINGELEKDKLSLFEKRLVEEDGFEAKVNDIQTLLLGIETQILKEKLNVFHKDIKEDSSVKNLNPNKVRNLPWKRLAFAAAIIIAAGSYWFLNTDTDQKLYANYYYPDPGLPTTMSSTDNYDFFEAMVSYKQGNYSLAISKWKMLENSKINSDTLNYFIGSALMAKNKQDEAITYFKKLSKSKSQVFKNERSFYLGLAYLKIGNKEAAIEALMESNLTEGKELLDKLKE